MSSNERAIEEVCPDCGQKNMFEVVDQGEYWVECLCGYVRDLEPPEPDPDRAYDEARERRLLGE